MNRLRNILHGPRTDVDKSRGQLVAHLLMHRAGNADTADLGQAFQARGDIDAIAEQIAIALDHVADADADAIAQLPAARIGEVPRAQAFLDIDGAAHRFDRAGEFRKDCIARRIEDAAAGHRDEVVRGGTTGRHSPQRLFFVLGDQPAVVGDVGHQNCGDLAPHEDIPH